MSSFVAVFAVPKGRAIVGRVPDASATLANTFRSVLGYEESVSFRISALRLTLSFNLMYYDVALTGHHLHVYELVTPRRTEQTGERIPPTASLTNLSCLLFMGSFGSPERVHLYLDKVHVLRMDFLSAQVFEISFFLPLVP